jgi:hypothetical protein
MKKQKIENKAWLEIIAEFENDSSDPWQREARHRVMSDFVWFMIETYGTPAKISFTPESK